jgi:hypothetical protein
MSLIYEWIGRLIVGLVWRVYGREIRTAAAVGVGVAVIAAGAYLASKDSEQES